MDEEIAREAMIMLSTAIAAMVEDVQPAVVSQLRNPTWLERAGELVALGEDIGIITRAIATLSKRMAMQR